MMKNISLKLRFEILKRDKFACQYCGAKAPDVVLHIDHKKPVSKGGSTKVSNLITACNLCNHGKHSDDLNDDSFIKNKEKIEQAVLDRMEQIKINKMREKMQRSIAFKPHLLEFLKSGSMTKKYQGAVSPFVNDILDEYFAKDVKK